MIFQLHTDIPILYGYSYQIQLFLPVTYYIFTNQAKPKQMDTKTKVMYVYIQQYLLREAFQSKKQ